LRLFTIIISPAELLTIQETVLSSATKLLEAKTMSDPPGAVLPHAWSIKEAPPIDEVEGATSSSSPASSEEAYHCLPESGDAKGVGSTTCKDVMVAPLEQEGHMPPEKNTMMLPFSSWRSYFYEDRRKPLVQMCYLGIAAILETLRHMILALLIGVECANPGTVGWLAASSPLCITAVGETSQQGGVVFADLPANVLGSFIMGLLQDGKNLELAVNVPIA
jgi:hypothetical protein